MLPNSGALAPGATSIASGDDRQPAFATGHRLERRHGGGKPDDRKLDHWPVALVDLRSDRCLPVARVSHPIEGVGQLIVGDGELAASVSRERGDHRPRRLVLVVRRARRGIGPAVRRPWRVEGRRKANATQRWERVVRADRLLITDRNRQRHQTLVGFRLLSQ